jgi:flagellar hook protein FlgE
MPSFDIPLSGLDADSTALNTIANNLSNMNTTGFKAQTTSFSDLLYQQVGASGSGDPIQVGTGVQVASNSTDFTTGNISTGVYTDAAINGTGFFVLDNGAGGQLLTRDGSFIVGGNGMLESVNGQPVMGYMASKGVINSSGTLTDIAVPTGQVMSPSATTSFNVTQNLDSTTAVGGPAPQSTLQIYDSLGNSYQATVTYTKTGTNAWNYSIALPSPVNANSSVPGTFSYTFGAPGVGIDTASNLTITGPAAGGGTATTGVPAFTGSPETITQYAADLTKALTAAGITTGAGGVTVTAAGSVLTISGATATSGSVIQDAVASNAASGSLTFDSSGNLVSPAADVSGITFSGLADGAAPINLTWDLYGSNGATSTLGQTASASSQSSQNQNGYAAGQYETFTIGSDGTITANYSNGQNQALAQIGIAMVNNQQGLLDTGSTQYLTTRASGNASVGVAGTGGRGVIEGGDTEASNVNISQEFSNLIIAQRAFEANSKAVTTFDTVTQETINMIH